MPRTVAATVTKEIKDLNVGDKILTDIIGYKGKIFFPQGFTLSFRDVQWLKKHAAKDEPPKLSSQYYVIGSKAKIAVRNKKGDVLVGPGKRIEIEAVKPLLKEGFQEIEVPGGGSMVHRKEVWPKDKPWHISQYNPFIHVETTTIVNDDGSRADLRKPLKGSDGGSKTTGNDKTATQTKD